MKIDGRIALWATMFVFQTLGLLSIYWKSEALGWSNRRITIAVLSGIVLLLIIASICIRVSELKKQRGGEM